MDDTGEEGGFSFIWTIQNYNFCFRKSKDHFYASPTFVLNDASDEKWCFNLYPERYFCHDSIGLALKKITGTKVSTSGSFSFGSGGFTASGSRASQQSHSDHPTITNEIILEVSIRDIRGSFDNKSKKKLVFQSNSCKSDMLKLKIYKEELEAYLSNDSLILKCKVWDLKNPILTTRQYYARTIIGVEMVTYPCTLKGFESDGSIDEGPFHIVSEVTTFTMKLFSTRETYAENKYQIVVQLTEPNKQCYSTCEISLLDAGGTIAHSVQEEHDFNDSNRGQVWTFPFIGVRKILKNQDLFLSTDGELRLRCEFTFSAGVAYNKVERTEYGVGISSNESECSGQTTDSDAPGSLKDNLQRFYEEGKFSDFTIRTPNKQFRVHKSILCARSEVFSAMFERDMKENQTGVVDIEDVDDDTVSKMVLFLYTDIVGEDLEFETASSLYFAADKYRIVALKKKCADFLKGTFTVSNVCDLLVLADMHQDENLKSAAQKFIFAHSKEIMNSAEWKKLMQNQLQLASEIMHSMIIKLQII